MVTVGEYGWLPEGVPHGEEHESALVEVQDTVTDEPALTDIGPSEPLAFIITVGTGSNCVQFIVNESESPGKTTCDDGDMPPYV